MRKRSPWLDSADIGATGRRFEIRTVTDFFQVPPERRRICLREFHTWLALQEDVTELMIAASGGKLPREALVWDNEVFAWEDNGKATMCVQMVPSERESEE